MTKQIVLNRLREGLSGFAREDVEERLAFYAEMIDDRMEEGLSEEEAVRELGSVETLIAQIAAELPAKPKRTYRIGTVLLLVLGSPLWLALLAAAFAVVVSFYAVLWSVLLSLWAAFVSAAVCVPACAAAGIFLLLRGNGLSAVALLGAVLICLGLSVFLFFGCRAATAAVLRGTKKLLRMIGKKKEGAYA